MMRQRISPPRCSGAGHTFRERFEAKGRMRSYLATIPCYVVTHRLPAFLGSAAALADGLA
jgi:glucokinase